MDRQADSHQTAERQTYRHTDRRQTDRHSNYTAHRQPLEGRQTDIQTDDKQTDRQTDMQTDDKQTDSHWTTDRQTYI
jgi:hypothetical protein